MGEFVVVSGCGPASLLKQRRGWDGQPLELPGLLCGAAGADASPLAAAGVVSGFFFGRGWVCQINGCGSKLSRRG